MAQLDRHTVRRCFLLLTPFFRSEKKWVGWGLVLLLFGLSLTVNAIGARMSYINRDFMTALNLKDSGRFTRELIAYVVAFLIATPIVVMYSYTEQRLSLMWRRWMSHYVLDRYFTDRTYYHLNLRGEIDNPDQRIEEDVRSFCAQSLSFSLILFNSCVQLFLYVWILWSISWWLFVVALGYAAIGSIATYLLGRPLIGLNFSQLRKEADYRYKLINIRDSAESIAFYGNERKEYTRTRQRLRAALQNLGLVINWNRNLQFFTTGYNYVLAVLPTVIVAPLFFDGKIEFGAVIQAGVAFGFVLNALSIVVNHFGNISIFAAVINRLGTFLEAIDQSKKSTKVGDGITTEIGPRLEFHKVAIFTPSREQMLIKELTFQLDGRSLLICGPSGSGKTSVLRAAAGLWSAGSGKIIRPPLSETYFIPQRPYMVLGTLRSQLLYGARGSGFIDRQLVQVLESVGLDEMLDRVGGLDAVFDWPNVLGTGEQQRLAMARVFLARPKLVFLDEATTAVDRQMEQRLYTMLLDHVQFFVSTGNRLTIGEFHDRVVELQADGRWSAI